ncbi:MAG TPA: NAD(P)H-hydrate dehydratase, partial [Candidatus Acidoferrum sp.]|nr:NAD(P)H-hydrate dehydratase [Candidatus Acidoferrum sp.]
AAHAEYMTEALPANTAGAISMEAIRSGRLAAALERKTVLALGPGLGTQEETTEFVHNVVANTEVPIVLDADGLNAFAGKGDLLARRKAAHLVVTPHPGEMARLVGMATADVQKDRLSCVKNAAQKWNAWVALKGFHTVLASPSGEVFVNTTGDAGLAKGGSGDVLTGLLAATIAQFGTKDLLRVVALGTYLHGSAAELLSLQSDPSGILAGEVADTIPYARRKLMEELQARA